MSKVKFKVTNPEVWLKEQLRRFSLNTPILEVAFSDKAYDYNEDAGTIFINDCGWHFVVLDGAELIHEAIKPSDCVHRLVKAKTRGDKIIEGYLGKYNADYLVQGIYIDEILEVIEC